MVLYDGAQAVAAEVLDFKTDTIDGSEEVGAKLEFYRPQLEAYRKAVARMFRLPTGRIAANLVLLSTARVVGCK